MQWSGHIHVDIPMLGWRGKWSPEHDMSEILPNTCHTWISDHVNALSRPRLNTAEQNNNEGNLIQNQNRLVANITKKR